MGHPCQGRSYLACARRWAVRRQLRAGPPAGSGPSWLRAGLHPATGRPQSVDAQCGWRTWRAEPRGFATAGEAEAAETAAGRPAALDDRSAGHAGPLAPSGVGRDGSTSSPLRSRERGRITRRRARKYSEFPSVDGRAGCDARRCWSTAVGAAGQATRADSLGGSVPAVSGWRAQAARSSGLSAQGRNRSRAAPVGGVPPAWAQACR